MNKQNPHLFTDIWKYWAGKLNIIRYFDILSKYYQLFFMGVKNKKWLPTGKQFYCLDVVHLKQVSKVGVIGVNNIIQVLNTCYIVNLYK